MEYCEEGELFFYNFTQYFTKGDLYKKIIEAKSKNIIFPEEQILNWLAQLALAINYMHENRILHRDIKPQNIFLTKQGIVLITYIIFILCYLVSLIN